MDWDAMASEGVKDHESMLRGHDLIAARWKEINGGGENAPMTPETAEALGEWHEGLRGQDRKDADAFMAHLNGMLQEGIDAYGA